MSQEDADFFAARGNARSAGMHPEFYGRLRTAVEDAEKATGQPVKFNSLTRTNDEQRAAYERYRTGQGGLAAPPGRSRHEVGEAADIEAGPGLDWLHKNSSNYGLNFLTGKAGRADRVHIQLDRNAKSADMPPDLLGSWQTATPAAPATSPATPQGATDDLLGSWAVPSGTAGEAPVTAPRRVSVHADMPVMLPGQIAIPARQSGQEESTPELVARLTAEHPGDTLTDRAVRVGAGAVRGIGDVADTLAKGIGAAGAGGAGVLERAGVIAPETAEKVRGWRSGIEQGIASDQAAYEDAAQGSLLSAGGRIGGQVAGAAPFLAAAGGAAMAPVNVLTRASPGIAQTLAQPSGALRLAQIIGAGVGVGGGAAALTSSTSDEPLAEQIKHGAIVGGILGPVGHGLGALGSRLLGGAVDQPTAALAQTARQQYGIPVSAGQISANPTIRFIDSVLQRLPLTGYGARTEQQVAAVNREVARTFGEHTEAITPDVIRAAKNRLGTVFEDVARRTGPIRVDARAATDLRNIANDAAIAPENVTQAVQRQIRNIASAIDPATGTISPEAYQALTRKGAPLNLAQKGGERTVAHYAGRLREAIDDMMERSAPPDVARSLVEARSQYRAMKTVEPLAEKAGPNGISLMLLRGAVNKGYPATARAPGAREQTLRDLAQITQRFIKETPSSRTAEQTMILQHLPQLAVGATGLGSLGAATYFDPDSWQRNALIGIGALGAGRLGASALRSNMLANALIRSGLRGAGGGGLAQEFINRGLPAAGALATREPLRLTVHPNPPSQ